MKKWYKKKETPITELEELRCLNCNHVFSGRFCPNCGQSVSEFDRPFGFIFYDFLGNFVAFDSRLFKTIFALIFKPGYLTSRFFEGKRASYAPPFRMFIFLSFVLFLLLQISTNKSLTSILDASYDEGVLNNDSIDFAELESYDVITVTEQQDSSKTADLDLNLNTIFKQENLRASLLFIAKIFEQQLEKTEDKDKRRTILKMIEILRSPSQLASRMLKYLSWAFFILLPVFALLLKLVYVRRKINYIRHLIFSVHIHSFMFLLFTIIIAINLFFSGDWTLTVFWAIFLLPIYSILALKLFYKQGWIKSIVKSLMVSFIYNLIIVVVFAFVFINAISDILPIFN